MLDKIVFYCMPRHFQIFLEEYNEHTALFLKLIYRDLHPDIYFTLQIVLFIFTAPRNHFKDDFNPNKTMGFSAHEI